MKYSELDDGQLSELIENRWKSSDTLWDEMQKVTKKNKETYQGKAAWWQYARIPPTRPRVSSNRIFTNMEAVINSIIANPPKPNLIPSRNSENAKKLSQMLEKVLNIRYTKLNVKETLRQGLRDLYFSRIIVLKPYWDGKTNDIAVRRVDPQKVRFSSTAKNELESDFAIEEIDSTVLQLIAKFPEKEEEILKAADIDSKRVLIENPLATYKEAWIGDELCIKFKSKILYKGKNPYWDYDGLLATREEMDELHTEKEEENGLSLSDKLSNMEKAQMSDISLGEDTEVDTPDMSVQDYRKQDTENQYESYLFNYFDLPRKPYIFATILNNEDRPTGITSFIEQSLSLQEVVDRTVYQIYLNTEMVNGITKVDSNATNVSKADAQTLRYDAGGVLWGKGVVDGVQREFGQGLPAFVFEALKDYRDEIDNIMAASSAFRGEREGQETKAGRLALIEQSFLRLNELVQTVDYVMSELFGWWMQLMKVKYTERHLVKELGPDQAVEAIEITRNDIEDGIEVRVIPGKTLPEDKQFMFDRAQEDFQRGLLSPIDYMTEAGYQNPKELARNAYEFAKDPASVLGIQEMPPEQMPGLPIPQEGMPQMPPGQVPMLES